VDNWDYANTRPNAVSIFRIEGEYLGSSSKPQIILDQTLRTIRGFILLDKSVTGYGLWARYHPAGWAFIDQATGLLYWVGLAAGLLQWRRFVYWWVFLLVPLFLTQVFSVGTPDGSRALMVAPFVFLFVGLGIETLIGLARASFWRYAVPAAVVTAVLAIGAFNVNRYFDWIDEPATLQARQPAIVVEEFPLYSELAREFAEDGRLISEADWLRYRQEALGQPTPP
jgi:hypothetical protein